METIQPSGVIGADVRRIDGVAKVTGKARYGADFPVDGAAFAYLATSAIAVGQIRDIDESAARQIPQVLDILTYKNVGKAVKSGKAMLDGGYMASSVAPLQSNRIYFAGQIVAVVIAPTFEAAAQAAAALSITYGPAVPAATFDSPGAEEVTPNPSAKSN